MQTEDEEERKKEGRKKSKREKERKHWSIEILKLREGSVSCLTPNSFFRLLGLELAKHTEETT